MNGEGTAQATPMAKRASMASIVWLVVFILVVLGVSALGGMATDTRGWFEALTKPAFNPPSWVFGPVWTVLYVMMAVAAWRVLLRAGWAAARRAMTLFGVQLALNLAWSWLFFAAQRPDLALVDIVALDLAVLATGWAFRRHDRLAAWLLVPYACWIAFATALNADFVRLNP
jgi:tryptophan-rich sensory protein